MCECVCSCACLKRLSESFNWALRQIINDYHKQWHFFTILFKNVPNDQLEYPGVVCKKLQKANKHHHYCLKCLCENKNNHTFCYLDDNYRSLGSGAEQKVTLVQLISHWQRESPSLHLFSACDVTLLLAAVPQRSNVQ